MLKSPFNMDDFNRSIAVVIGIDQYKDGITPLRTAVNDAQAVGDMLEKKHRYDPIYLLLDEEATLVRLQSFLTKELPPQIQKDDRLLFYFAGHGIALADDDIPVGYLVPQDAQRQNADSFLSMQCVHDALIALKCRHMLAILDCCFAGAFRWITTRQLRPVQPKLYQERYGRYIKDPAWQVITSAAHDEEALDILGKRYQTGRRDLDFTAVGGNGSVEHSPFAEALLDALETGEADAPVPGDGVITATDLYMYLRNRVEPADPNRYLRQTPGLWPLKKHDKGEYVFVFPERLKSLPKAVELNRENNPYQGLKAYEEEHQDLFFGREALLKTLQTHVTEQPFTTVLGPSGVGKSSLVKAGLLPKLRASTDQVWTIAPPIRPTWAPLGALAGLCLPGGAQPGSALCTGAKDGATATWTLSSSVATDLSQRLESWFATYPGQRLVLVVDQFEELFTLCDNEEERSLFFEQLVTAAIQHQERLRIIATLRSDFEPRCVQLLDSVKLSGFRWATTRFVVGAMTHEELRDVIEKPAAERVLYFDPSRLVDDLVHEVVQMPGALPLLSFTLSELYIKYVESAREDRTLTQVDYDALGGVVGSLKHRADEEHASLDEDHQQSMQHLMLRMISLEGGERARRRVSDAELIFEEQAEHNRVKTIVERLISARLLVSDQDAAGNSSFEPAHDELVRGWPRLSAWMNEAQTGQDDLFFRRRLTQAAQLWHNMETNEKSLNQYLRWVINRLPEAVWGYPLRPAQPRAGLLWSDNARSAVLTTVLAREHRWMNANEIEFARRSIEQKGLNRRIRHAAIAVLIALTVIAGTAAAIANNRRIAASRNLSNEQRSTSLRRSIQATEQLTEDPVASLHLSLAALPGPENVRPYVAESELALIRAIRTSQERAFLDFTEAGSDVALMDQQVAWSDHRIAVGGDGLHLVTPTLTEVITLTRQTTETVKGVAWSEHGLLLSYDKQNIEVWQEATKTASQTLADEITCAWWQPEGEQIAICSGQRVWLWAIADDALLSLPEFPTNVKDLRWSRNGQYVAAWDLGNTVLLWDLTAGERLSIPQPEQPSQIWDVAWSPDSRHLVISATDGTQRLVAIDAPDDPHAIQGDESQKQRHAVFVDDRRFVTWAQEDATRLWTVDAVERPIFDFGNDPVEKIVPVAEREALLMLTTNGAAQLWSLAKDQPSRVSSVSGHTGKILAAEWDGTGQYLATSGIDGTARVWDMAKQTVVTTLRGHIGPVFNERTDVLGVRWQDDRHVVTYGVDGSLRRWQVFDNRGEPLCNGEDVNGLPRCFDENGTFYGHGGFIHFAQWLDDNVIITASRDGAAGRLDLSADEPSVQLLLPESLGPLAPAVLWGPDGRQVFTYQPQSALSGAQDSAGLVRDFGTGAELATIPGLIEAAFWLQSGLLLSDAENNVRLVDPQTGETIRLLNGYQSQILAAQQYGESLLATGEEDGIIRVWNLPTTEPPVILNDAMPIEMRLPVVGLQWSKDGSRLLSMGRILMLWDMENKARLWPLIDTGHDATYAVFSPDNELIATAIGTSVAVLEASSGRVLWADEEDHDQAVRGVSWLVGRTWPYQQAAWRERLSLFADNERLLLLTWSADATARVWDWQNDSEIMRLTDIGFEGISSAAVSSDGARIVTTTGAFTSAGPQGIIRVWQTWHRSPDTLLEMAQSRITRPLSSVQKDVFVIN